MSHPLWTSQELVAATCGDVHLPFSCQDLSIDTRELQKGDLFIALKGPHFDGHDYVIQALDKGASGAIVSHTWYDQQKDILGLQKRPLLVVDDPMDALRLMARAARHRTKAKVIGITGSFGKTSMKSLVAHVLSGFGSVHQTQQSHNGYLGVPLTLAKMPQDVDYAVIEMGMDEAGEMRSHTNLARPDIAVVTITGHAHVGKLGSPEAIARAKAEIFEGLQDHGIGVINNQDRFAKLLKEAIGDHPCLTFSKEQHQLDTHEDEAATVSSYDAKYDSEGVSMLVKINQHSCAPRFNIQGLSPHWEDTVPGCLAILSALGLDCERAAQTLKAYQVPQGRGQILRSGDFIIIDESYNAGPESMAMALKTFAKLDKKPKQRLIAILGDMLELGDMSATHHQGLIGVMDLHKIDLIFCVGDEMQQLAKILPKKHLGGAYQTPQEALEDVLSCAQEGDVFLIKGSRGQYAKRGRMSLIVDALYDLGQKKESSDLTLIKARKHR